MSGYDQCMPEEGRVYGFMLASVLANNDEENKGMLKLRLLYEGQGKTALSGVKVLAPFAGKDYGTYALPEVGEQVVVGFFEGCIDRPFVLGSLYAVGDNMIANSFHKENNLKRLKTKGGSVVEFSDEKDDESITIKTPKKLKVEMKEKDEAIRITTGDTLITIDGKKGKVHVKGKNELLLESGSAKLSMKSDGTVSLQGNNVSIKGSAVKVESSGSLDVKGQKTGVAGSMVDLKSDGILTLKGSLTKVN